LQPSRDVDLAAVVAVAAASLLLTLLPAAARPQVWRLVSNFTFLGKPSLGWLFQLVWLAQYGGAYEQAKFAGNTADGITCLGVGVIAGMSLDLLSYLGARLVPPVFFSYFHAAAIIFMFVYLWSRHFAEAPVSLFGIIKLNGRHLPFAFLALDLLMGQDIWSGVLGILMGHTWVAPPTTPACAVAQPGRGLLSGSTG
jgi:Derlin-2/3